ncbi:hypothetical protein CROQUDRAFT_184725 [Cronartium quercuum f. sp. fusiforme G11]|uniref:Nudix hydrolase domain-containing protein n=1 Tax=Cronartium quercuum f. sp. fusiforme G11 TaxID=708437 RepID=A0A9P6ND91_9BASI|nr:hypothetical protein CROQUDRAFT_184725 [Cronartium quercuum f. sp. fusiforme G11]
MRPQLVVYVTLAWMVASRSTIPRETSKRLMKRFHDAELLPEAKAVTEPFAESITKEAGVSLDLNPGTFNTGSDELEPKLIFPTVTQTTTLQKEKQLAYKQATIEKQGMGEMNWEYVEHIYRDPSGIDRASGLVIHKAENEGGNSYVPLVLQYRGVFNEWILEPQEWLHESTGKQGHSVKNGQEADGATSSEVFYKSGTQAIDAGASSATAKIYLGIKTLGADYKPAATEHNPSDTTRVLHVPTHLLEQFVEEWGSRGQKIDSSLSNIVAGMKLYPKVEELYIETGFQKLLHQKSTGGQTALEFVSQSNKLLSEILEHLSVNKKEVPEESSILAKKTVLGELVSENRGGEHFEASNPATKPERSIPVSIERKVIRGGRFLHFMQAKLMGKDEEILEYLDYYERAKKDKIGIDSVSGLVIQNIEREIPYIPLVVQHRPPHATWLLELPAGLREANESPRDAFIREHLEETGEGKPGKTTTLDSKGQSGGTDPEPRSNLIYESGFQVKDPAIGSATATTYLGLNKLAADYKPEGTKHEAAETMIVVNVPAHLFEQFVEDWGAKGLKLDAGLSNIAAGMKLYSKVQELQHGTRTEGAEIEALEEVFNSHQGLSDLLKNQLNRIPAHQDEGSISEKPAGN